MAEFTGADLFPVRECLGDVLDEEWHHRLYAERDLDILEAQSPSPTRRDA